MFWRAKPSKSGEATDAADAPASASKASAAQSAADATTNVVSIVQQRLSDRLADASPSSAAPKISKDIDSVAAPEVLRSAIRQIKPGGHILVLGGSGPETRQTVTQLAEIRAETLEAPPDWIYVPDVERPGRLDPIALPHGEAVRFVGDANAALEKSAAMFDRLVAADDHRLSRARPPRTAPRPARSAGPSAGPPVPGRDPLPPGARALRSGAGHGTIRHELSLRPARRRLSGLTPTIPRPTWRYVVTGPGESAPARSRRVAATLIP